jgi:Alpha galactosidase A/Alpha galactosidase C-terminal beta sandwich domain
MGINALLGADDDTMRDRRRRTWGLTMHRGKTIVTAATALALALAGAWFVTGTPAAAATNGLSIRPAMGWSSWSFVRRWPTDYLKIDGVGSADIPDVQAWATALKATGRPINYALSNNLPIAYATTWRQQANSWRTQGDVECYCGSGPNGSGYPLTDWSHVSSRFGSAASWQPYAGPGGWNDLDSLEIGNGDQVGLTADQRRSMFTLWAMAGAPLLLGTDLTNLTSTDLAMLDNDRLIGVDQDGYAAARIVNSGVNQVFRKHEDSGAFVVALFNTGTSGDSTVSVSWSQVGFSGAGDVTNLWSGSHVGTVPLAAGSNTIRVTATTSGGAPNLDYLDVG